MNRGSLRGFSAPFRNRGFRKVNSTDLERGYYYPNETAHGVISGTSGEDEDWAFRQPTHAGIHDPDIVPLLLSQYQGGQTGIPLQTKEGGSWRNTGLRLLKQMGNRDSVIPGWQYYFNNSITSLGASAGTASGTVGTKFITLSKPPGREALGRTLWVADGYSSGVPSMFNIQAVNGSTVTVSGTLNSTFTGSTAVLLQGFGIPNAYDATNQAVVYSGGFTSSQPGGFYFNSPICSGHPNPPQMAFFACHYKVVALPSTATTYMGAGMLSTGGAGVIAAVGGDGKLHIRRVYDNINLASTTASAVAVNDFIYLTRYGPYWNAWAVAGTSGQKKSGTNLEITAAPLLNPWGFDSLLTANQMGMIWGDNTGKTDTHWFVG